MGWQWLRKPPSPSSPQDDRRQRECRPDSSAVQPPIGNRLNRLIMKPQSPSAIDDCEPVAWPANAGARRDTAHDQPGEGHDGALCRSGRQFLHLDHSADKGDGIGEKGRPKCHGGMWPHSWMKMRPTMPHP